VGGRRGALWRSRRVGRWLTRSARPGGVSQPVLDHVSGWYRGAGSMSAARGGRATGVGLGGGGGVPAGMRTGPRVVASAAILRTRLGRIRLPADLACPLRPDFRSRQVSGARGLRWWRGGTRGCRSRCTRRSQEWRRDGGDTQGPSAGRWRLRRGDPEYVSAPVGSHPPAPTRLREVGGGAREGVLCVGPRPGRGPDDEFPVGLLRGPRELVCPDRVGSRGME
jgi:hypothetical protein